MASIALTTVFTPPSSCFNNVYTSLGGGVYEKDVSIESDECYPTAYGSIFSEEIPYSPGVCPARYSYDSVTSYRDHATAALCCPLGMTAMASGMGCNTQIDAATELYVGGSTITVEQAVLAAHGVYVAWRSDDSVQPVNPASTSSFSTSFTGGAYPAPQTSKTVARSTSSESTEPLFSSGAIASGSDPRTSRTASDLETPLTLTTSVNTKFSPSTGPVISSHSPAQPTQTTPPLSTGAKAGVGVGVSIGGVAFAAAAAWFIFKRRRSQQVSAYASSQPEMYEANGESSARTKAHHVSELSTEGGRSELSGTLPWIEATPKETRAELDSQ